MHRIGIFVLGCMLATSAQAQSGTTKKPAQGKWPTPPAEMTKEPRQPSEGDLAKIHETYRGVVGRCGKDVMAANPNLNVDIVLHFDRNGHYERATARLARLDDPNEMRQSAAMLEALSKCTIPNLDNAEWHGRSAVLPVHFFGSAEASAVSQPPQKQTGASDTKDISSSPIAIDVAQTLKEIDQTDQLRAGYVNSILAALRTCWSVLSNPLPLTVKLTLNKTGGLSAPPVIVRAPASRDAPPKVYAALGALPYCKLPERAGRLAEDTFDEMEIDFVPELPATRKIDPAKIAALLDKRNTDPAKAQKPQDEFADAIKAYHKKVLTCWTPPSTFTTVTLRVRLNEDGSFIGEPTDIEPNNDPAHRQSLDTAIAALKRCPPNEFPRKLYALWKDLDIVFSSQSPAKP